MTNLYKTPSIVWGDTEGGFVSLNTIRNYNIRPNSPINPDSSKPYVVCYDGKQKYFDSAVEAKEWVQTVNYPSVIAEYLEPVSEPVGDILNWFKLAVPKPTWKNKSVQLGVHFEEVIEMMCSLVTGATPKDSGDINKLAWAFKNAPKEEYLALENLTDKIELLDSLCDQIVTALGVGYMFDFDMEKALAEVNRSNWSKFENGKPVFDENGKIAKPVSYSKPNLEGFFLAKSSEVQDD